MKDNVCKSCNGVGMQADDEGWQYECSACHGTGVRTEAKEARIMTVDENNRLLD